MNRRWRSRVATVGLWTWPCSKASSAFLIVWPSPILLPARSASEWAPRLAAPHNHYPTRDGKWVAIACTNDRIFARLASLMGMEQPTTDPRFSGERERVANRPAIDAIVESWTRGRDMTSVIALLNKSEIPCSPINSIADIFQDPQFAAAKLCLTRNTPC